MKGLNFKLKAQFKILMFLCLAWHQKHPQKYIVKNRLGKQVQVTPKIILTN